RPGSHSLVDILVLGDTVGRNAAEYALEVPTPAPMKAAADDCFAWIGGLFELSSTGSPLPNGALRRRHLEMMDEHMGVLRLEMGMRTMLEEVRRARAEDLPRLRVFDARRAYNYELRDVLEMFYRIEVEEMATRGAVE